MKASPGRSMKTKSAKAKRRFTKAQWLEEAICLLEEQGPKAMTLESLTTNIGVTTGSFYHHFENYDRFLDELADKYIEDYTNVVGEYLATLDLPSRELLIEAMREIITNGLGGMDVHFRALAIAYPRLADKIRGMDDFRTGVIGGLFQGMGYTGNELNMRVHTFVVLHSMEAAVTTSLTPEDRLRLIDERVRLLID